MSDATNHSVPGITEHRGPGQCITPRMRGDIAVTDGDWAASLAAMGASEVNCWLPSPNGAFRALRVTEPFLIKTHYPDNRIVGGGFFEHFTVRLREEFSNGEEFYARDGETIHLPKSPGERPNAEFLEWHGDEVFLAS